MNFFKSVFTPDPEPSDDDDPQHHDAEDDDVSPTATDSTTANNTITAGTGSRWDFGGLIKTLATKSETVIQTYRRDLEEFGSGLKAETAVIREVAARAVGDLPTSLEAGASAAQESLESVGQVIDDFGGSVWRGTTEFIAQGKEAILAMESESNSLAEPGSASGAAKRYSRFEVQVLAVQNDVRTFAEEPEDGEDFEKWRLGFVLGDKEEEIEILCYENSAVEGFLEKLVPGVVDYETFWSRYYYRVFKLKQAEDARAKLVKRVIDREEEEDLSWDVDDDDEAVVVEEGKKGEKNSESSDEIGVVKREVTEEKSRELVEVKDSWEIGEVKKEVIAEKTDEKVDAKEKEAAEVEVKSAVEEKTVTEELKSDKLESKEVEVVKKEVQNSGEVENPQGAGVEEPSEDKKVIEEQDVPNLSSKPSDPEEEDLEWDEIEDLGELEEKKATDSNKSPVKADLMKRLSAADEDDLSWDIEDDDEPVKP